MATVVDFHAHIFPPPPSTLSAPWLEGMRRKTRHWLKPVSASLHRAQTALRHLPTPARRILDPMSGLVPLPALLFESTLADLQEAMEEAEVQHALVIAHPPLMSNELVLEAAQSDPRLIPVVNLPSHTPRVKATLKGYYEQGARVLKVHPAADGESPRSGWYRTLLGAASDLGMPVILHTGCIHSTVLYKKPEYGKAELYSRWFENFRETPFVLAHMNFHEPHVAMDLAQNYPNVQVDTSWQPAEMVSEAVRRVGAEKVLFGSDWPFVGNNLSIGLNRIYDCLDSGWLNEEQAALILGKNALKLLGRTESE